MEQRCCQTHSALRLFGTHAVRKTFGKFLLSLVRGYPCYTFTLAGPPMSVLLDDIRCAVRNKVFSSYDGLFAWSPACNFGGYNSCCSFFHMFGFTCAYAENAMGILASRECADTPGLLRGQWLCGISFS